MVEYWNVGLNKELIDFIASLSRPARHRSRSGEAGGGILAIDQYPIFPEPIIP